MINLWQFQNSEQVQIEDVDGNIFKGKVISIDDAEDNSDLEPNEDSISIMTDNGNFVGFYLSEILKINSLPSNTPKNL